MKISKQARRDAKELFRSALVNGIMNEDKVRQVIRLLGEKKPRGYVAILEHLKRLIKLEIDRRRATVESPIAMTAEQQAAVSANLARIYGPGLNLSFAPNPELLGGLRVRVGSDVYDGTIQARLGRLEESFG